MKFVPLFFIAISLNAQGLTKIVRQSPFAGAVGPMTSTTAAATNSPATSEPFEENPSDADAQLFVFNGSFHNCTSQVVNILVVGDSLAYGYGANIPNQGGWVGRFTSNLQQVCPSHGTGIIPAYEPQWGQTVVSTDNLTPAHGWSMISGFGPYQSNAEYPFGTLYEGGQGTGAATISGQVGDTAIVYYATFNDSGRGFGVTVDGGLISYYGAVATNTFAAASVAIPLPGGLGAHSISIIPPVSGHMYLYGVEFTSGKVGISVHNEARPGAQAEAFGLDPINQNAFWPLISGGVQLVIDSLGIDDLTSWNASNYQTYQQNMVANWAALNSPAPSLFVLDENHSESDNSTNKVQLQQIELGLGGAYASVADRWGPWTNANLLGLMFDSAHPNDKGYEDITAMLTALLAAGASDSTSNATFTSVTVSGTANAAHVGSSGGSPTISSGSGTTGGSVSVAGSDNNGLATFNTGPGSPSGIMGTIKFNQPWVNTATSVVACILQAANPAAATASNSVYVSAVTTTGFTVSANSTLKGSTSYAYYYHCGN